MRARWVVPAALAVVLACAPARAELRARTRDLGGSAVATGNVDFTSQPTSATCAAPTSLAMTRPAGSATFARSDTSPACCPESDAACCSVAIDQPCVHSAAYSGSMGGGGAEAFGTGENRIAYASDLRSWTQRSGTPVTVAYSATGGPSNGPYSALVGLGAKPTADIYTLASGFTSGGPAATGFFIRKATATGMLNVQNAEGTAYGQWNVDLSKLAASTWELVHSGHAAVTVVTAFVANGTAAGLLLNVASGTLDLDVAQVNQQSSPVLKPPRLTTGVAYAGSASTATSLVLPATATNPAKWAISIKATPAGAGWARTNTIGLWQWGGTYGAANSVSAYVDASSKIVVEVYDGASGWKRWTSTNALTGAAQRSIAVGFNAGAYRVLVDGSEVAGSTSGAGTGLLGALPTATLTLGIVGSSVLSGTVACVRQGADLAAVKGCQ